MLSSRDPMISWTCPSATLLRTKCQMRISSCSFAARRKVDGSLQQRVTGLERRSPTGRLAALVLPRGASSELFAHLPMRMNLHRRGSMTSSNVNVHIYFVPAIIEKTHYFLLRSLRSLAVTRFHPISLRVIDQTDTDLSCQTFFKAPKFHPHLGSVDSTCLHAAGSFPPRGSASRTLDARPIADGKEAEMEGETRRAGIRE